MASGIVGASIGEGERVVNRRIFWGTGIGALLFALVGLMTLNASAGPQQQKNGGTGGQGIVSMHLGF
jgi:hypothetical protein